MLATAGEARDSSPDVILGTGASKDLDIKPSAAGSVHKKPGESVADSIAKELSYWEKVVFSFDMDRESGASSSGSGQRGSGQDNSRRQGRTGQAGSSSSSGNPASSSQTHAQANPNQPHNTQFSSHSPPLLSPMQLAQLGQMGALSLPGLDPYTVAQLTALSALVNQTTPPAPLPGTAQHNPSLNSPDAYAILRQMQGLLHPSSGPSNLPSSSQYPAYQSAFQQQPTATQSHVPSTATSSGHSAHHHPQHHPLAPNLPGLGWPLTQYPSIGQFPPHATSPHESSHQQPHGQGQTHSPPLIFPGLFPRQAQSPGAGPSTGGGSNESQSTVTGRTSTSPASPTTPMTPGPEMDETAMTEDKRRRNTAASARFRIKKKHKTLALERSVVDLEGRADDLEREAAELRRENGWLKEMLIMKGRRVRAAAETQQDEDDDDNSEESEDEDEDEEGSGDAGHPSASKGKGKERKK